MSAEIVGVEGGILTLKVSGRLMLSELTAVQKQGAEILRQHGKMSILVLGEGFDGWDPGDDWSDISFQLEYDQFIEKIALVGEKCWGELAQIFAGRGLREARVEYFPSTDLPKARAWLTANP